MIKLKGIKILPDYLKRHTGQFLGLFMTFIMLFGYIVPVFAFYRKQDEAGTTHLAGNSERRYLVKPILEASTLGILNNNFIIQYSARYTQSAKDFIELHPIHFKSLELPSLRFQWNRPDFGWIRHTLDFGHLDTMLGEPRVIHEQFLNNFIIGVQRTHTLNLENKLYRSMLKSWGHYDWFNKNIEIRNLELVFPVWSSIINRTFVYYYGSETNLINNRVLTWQSLDELNLKSLFIRFGFLKTHLDINHPENLSEINDFNFWRVSVSVAYDTPAKEILAVRYRAVGEVRYNEDYILVDRLSGNFLITKKLNLIEGVEYEAWIYAQVGSLEYPPIRMFEQTTKIRFRIIGTHIIPTLPILPRLPAEVVCSVQTHGTIGYFLCLAFNPSRESFSRFLTLGDFLRTRIPIGYFFLIRTELENIRETTPMFILPAVITELQPLVFTPIRTGIIFIFWFLFILYIFKRIKNLEF